MVRGIDKFREAFANFTSNYVIIGGSACEVYEDKSGQIPRATRDIDIILIVEALSHDFVARFWQFVKAAGYTEKQVGEKGINPKHQYYRFNNPTDSNYPIQIELFSRSLGIFNLPKELNITPIPTDTDLSSLSAILLDEYYYNYTISHSVVIEGVHLATIESLIVLRPRSPIFVNAGAVKRRADVFAQ